MAAVHRPRGLRRGLMVYSVLLSILLVITTAVAVGGAVSQAVSRQIEQSEDQRLADGAIVFKALLDDTHGDLTAVGTWLLRDDQFLAAVRDDRRTELTARLGLAGRLHAVDVALVAGGSGRIITRLLTSGRPSGGAQTVLRDAAFRQARAGRTLYGITRDARGPLQQEVDLPVRSPDGRHVQAVLRLLAFLDHNDLERFHWYTGLDISLFFRDTRLVTTLRQPNGAFTAGSAPPAIVREVMQHGHAVYAWRDLPSGRVRAYYVPLLGPDGARVGMIAVAVSLSALQGEWSHALLSVLPVTLAIILGGALLAYLLAREVRSPILLLAAAAARLRDGDLATAIPAVVQAELAPLAEELERARRSVHAHLEAVAHEEARQRALFAALREPILTASPEGIVTGFNPAAVSLLGDPERLRGCAIQELLPFVPVRGEQERDSAPWMGQLIDAVGHPLDLEVSLTSLASGHGPTSDVYIVHDISRHAELNRLREQLLHNVAHELRAPLAILDNALEILASDYGELSAAEFDRILGSARRTAKRLRVLMEDLLSAGSIQAGRFVVRAQPIPVADIMAEALEMAEVTLGARRQHIEVHMSSPCLRAHADPGAARQALANLIENAAKYSGAMSAIQVRAEQTAEHVRLMVVDDGPGIALEQQASLFERYYRVRPGHSEPGIGLGLAIVKGIAEAHGGCVGIESAAGAGTAIWFTLPLVREPG